MNAIIDHLKDENIHIIKIDVEKNPAIASSFKIKEIPTFVIQQNGKSKWQQSGVMTDAYLKEILNKYNSLQ